MISQIFRQGRRAIPARVASIVAIACACFLIPIPPAMGGESEREVSYAPSALEDFDQSYDLYRPDAGGGALVIFVHSRFWRERQPAHLIEESFVPGLLQAGYAVAVLRHRLVPGGRHPVAIQDVARGVAALLTRAESFEFDSERVFLAGHSSGAQLALLLALDPSWLSEHGKTANALAGVISISGILDTRPGRAGSEEEEALYQAAFRNEADRVAASPAIHSGIGVASILFLVAAHDVPGYRDAAAARARDLREAGHRAVEAFVANGRDHYSILDLANAENDARRHLFAYLESRPHTGQLPEAFRVASTWRDPPFTTADFHERFPNLVKRHQADKRFNHVLNRPFRTKPGTRDRLAIRNYEAIDLVEMLSALGASELGTGDWLELRNARGEWASFSLAQLRALSPQVVIGLDGERNLFRATDLYHTKRRYSWVDPMPTQINMARPLGAFLYFPAKEPDLNRNNDFIGRYALTVDSFRLRSDDPFARFAELSESLRTTLIASPGCLGCHQFRGVGGRALHIRADDGSTMGGHALPLERYPAIVWKRFVFDQAAVAEEVGASAINFEPKLAQSLFDLIVRQRETQGVEPWDYPDRDRNSN